MRLGDALTLARQEHFKVLRGLQWAARVLVSEGGSEKRNITVLAFRGNAFVAYDPSTQQEVGDLSPRIGATVASRGVVLHRDHVLPWLVWESLKLFEVDCCGGHRSWGRGHHG